MMNPTIKIKTRMMGVIHHALLCTMKSMNSANRPLFSLGICESDMGNLAKASNNERKLVYNVRIGQHEMHS